MACSAKHIKTAIKFYVPAILLALLLLIACNPLLSKEEKRRIKELKGYVLDNPVKINSPHDKYGIPIHYAVLNNYSFLIKWLISHNADVNIKNKNGETPLHYSIYGNSSKNKIRSLLIKCGANTNSTNKYRETPLHYAATYGKMDVAKLLLSHGAKVNARTGSGETPLHYATRQPSGPKEKRVSTAGLMLENGADINVKDNYGRTPLHLASLVGNVEMTGFLLKKGANPDLAIPNGQSPIHTASSMGHAELVEVLIKGGATVNQRDNEGMTPLKRALHFPSIHYEAGKKEPIDTSAVVQLLQDYGGIE
jgi:serine/threonine-protein phosphatase 6 regulatory ankyrin repeat subunit B